MYKVYKKGSLIFSSIVEVWKDVKNYESVYSVSSFGRIKSKDKVRLKVRQGKPVEAFYQGKLISPKETKYGYLQVGLYDVDKKSFHNIHRIVATAFIPGNNDLTVNHKDGDKKNNNVSNLEWSTHKEQMDHAFSNGLIKPRGNHKFSPDFKKEVLLYYKQSKCSIQKLAEHFSISNRTAGRIAKGQIERKGLKISDEDVQLVLQLRESGNTLKSIAEQVGCGISQIHRITRGLSRNIQYEV